MEKQMSLGVIPPPHCLINLVYTMMTLGRAGPGVN
jgi:hypothetical protein